MSLVILERISIWHMLCSDPGYQQPFSLHVVALQAQSGILDTWLVAVCVHKHQSLASCSCCWFVATNHLLTAVRYPLTSEGEAGLQVCSRVAACIPVLAETFQPNSGGDLRGLSAGWVHCADGADQSSPAHFSLPNHWSR